MTLIMRMVMAAVCGVGAMVAAAQAQPAPQKGAAAGKTLGGASAPATGRMLTKDELRSCLQQQDELKRRGSELELRQHALDAERKAIVAEGEGLKAQRDAVDDRNRLVQGWNQRMAAHQAAVQAWDARVKAYNESQPSPDQAARQQAALREEQGALERAGRTLETERNALGGQGIDVQRLNEQAKAQAEKAAAWNDRNQQTSQQAQAYETDRANWRTTCGSRRYREDDEIAIRAGK